MHVSADPPERRPRRGLLVLLGAGALLAVVAIASSGEVPLGTHHTRRPSAEILDTIVSLVLVIVLAGGLVVFYVYYLQRTNTYEERRKGGISGNLRGLAALAALAIVLLVLAIGTAAYKRHHNNVGGLAGVNTSGASTKSSGGYTPRFATVPVAVILGSAAIASLAAYLSRRARRRALVPLAHGPTLALTLADVLDETLDDLRAEPDPRTAVIAAYARLERTLGTLGLSRRDSDAPAEYLRRILIDLEVGARPATRLTQLFEHAKFSPHRVGAEMKEEAIALLESIRADLHAADAARKAVGPSDRPVGEPA